MVSKAQAQGKFARMLRAAVVVVVVAGAYSERNFQSLSQSGAERKLLQAAGNMTTLGREDPNTPPPTTQPVATTPTRNAVGPAGTTFSNASPPQTNAVIGPGESTASETTARQIADNPNATTPNATGNLTAGNVTVGNMTSGNDMAGNRTDGNVTSQWGNATTAVDANATTTVGIVETVEQTTTPEPFVIENVTTTVDNFNETIKVMLPSGQGAILPSRSVLEMNITIGVETVPPDIGSENVQDLILISDILQFSPPRLEFDKLITVFILLDDDQIRTDEAAMYKFDEFSELWVEVPGSTINRNNVSTYVVAKTLSFGIFAVFKPKPPPEGMVTTPPPLAATLVSKGELPPLPIELWLLAVIAVLSVLVIWILACCCGRICLARRNKDSEDDMEDGLGASMIGEEVAAT